MGAKLTICQLFICVCAVGVILVAIFLPETKGVPLEEIAAIFGDQDEVVVFSEDIQVGGSGDELVVKEHHEKGAATDSAKDEGAPTHRETIVLSA